MAAARYPLSPPSSQFKSSDMNGSDETYTYRTALRSGNPFPCLPRHVRDKIYSYTLDDFLSSENSFNEVPELRDFTYPDICQVDDFLYNEACQIIIKNTTFTLVSERAIFHFMTFLEEFKNKEEADGFAGKLSTGEGFDNVTSVEFVGLGLWERGMFASAAKMLLKRCPNLSLVSLVVDWDDLLWVDGEAGVELDIDVMAKTYDLEALVDLNHLETVKLGLEPSMSLQKRLSRMEAAREQADKKSGRTTGGFEGFWGLGQWMELKCLQQMRLITVLCPTLGVA